MATDLIEQITSDEASRRSEALTAYRDVLLRHAKPEKGDTSRLREVMATLGKTAADAAADLRIVERASALEKAAQASDDPELAARIAAASEAHGNFEKETARIAAEREGEKARLWGVFTELNAKRTAGHDAKRELAEFRERHWQLFGLDDPRPAEQPRSLLGSSVPCDIGRESGPKRPRYEVIAPQILPDGSIVYGRPAQSGPEPVGEPSGESALTAEEEATLDEEHQAAEADAAARLAAAAGVPQNDAEVVAGRAPGVAKAIPQREHEPGIRHAEAKQL
jgi:hypothetical protein